MVEETPVIGTNRSKLIVQFDNQAAINQFNAERALWETDAQKEAILTYAKRQDLFIAIQEINKEYQQQKTNQRSPMDGPARKHPQYRGEARGVI